MKNTVVVVAGGLVTFTLRVTVLPAMSMLSQSMLCGAKLTSSRKSPSNTSAA